MTTLCKKFEIFRANYYRSRQFSNVFDHQNAKSQKNALMKTTVEIKSKNKTSIEKKNSTNEFFRRCDYEKAANAENRKLVDYVRNAIDLEQSNDSEILKTRN